MGKGKYNSDWLSDPGRMTFYDPELLFRYSFERLEKSARGTEYLLYKLIPLSVIRSITAAIDPFYKFKVSPQGVSTVTRTRSRRLISVLDTRRIKNHEEVYGTQMNDNVIISDGKSIDNTWYTSKPSQESLPRIFSDTTKSSRPANVNYGEMESFQGSLNSPSQVVRYSDIVDSWTAGPSVYSRSYTRRYETYQDEGPTYRLTRGDYDTILSSCRSRRDSALNAHGPTLIKKALPSSRDTTLFRNIIELKDLPRSISQLRETTRHLKDFYSILTPEQIHALWKNSGHLLKDIPKEYLSYVFGWRQTYHDILELLFKPEKIAKRIAYLQTRSGLATTFRSSMGLPTEEGPVYPSVYLREDSTPGYSRMINPTWVDFHRIHSNLRCTINARFDFPTVAIPEFSDKLFDRKLGVNPTFTDLYNLVPWTWLLDWGTGIGNYLDAIETINNDKSLINEGFLTIRSDGVLGKTNSWTESHLQRRYVAGQPGWVDSSTFPRITFQGTFDYTYKARKSLAAGYGVRSLADIGSLSPYQQSILGSIILSRR